MHLHRKLHVFKALALGAGLLSFSSAHALNPVAPPNSDAGALQRQLEQNMPLPMPQLRRQPETAVEPLKEIVGATVTVSRFKFVGNTLVSSEKLAELLQSYLNKPVGFAQLQQATQVISEAYRAQGWVVRVYLPKQEIEKGEVTIQIVEAVFGKVSITGEQTPHVQAQRLVAIVQRAQPAGTVVRRANIDRALLLLDDLPGVAVTGNLNEGEQSGETDLVLSVTNEPWLSGNVSTDNTGSRSTGIERLSGNFNVSSPLKQGDAVAVNLLKTLGSEYERLAYSFPLGFEGWRSGAHMTHLHYSLLGSFAGFYGTSDTAGLDLSYPLVRSQMTNVNLQMGWDGKHFFNVASTGTASDYSLSVANASLNANQMDSWAGGGTNNASLGLTHGKVNLNGSPNQSTDAASANTAGAYNKLSVSLNRLQTLTENLSAYVAFNMQRANRNLDSSEKLYLGGANGVRAFPSGEGGGAQGQTLTAELRQRLNASYTLTGFYDYGRATAYKDNNYADGSAKLNSGAFANSYALRGFGVALTWAVASGSEIKASLARRASDNPLANTTTGMDGDGTKFMNRIWVSASMSF